MWIRRMSKKMEVCKRIFPESMSGIDPEKRNILTMTRGLPEGGA